MRLNKLFFFIAFLLFLLPVCPLYAQKKNDTLIVDGTQKDTSGKSLLALDKAISKKHSPQKAIFRSAVLPGWGQAYNKKYWKIPIVYGALGATAAVFLFNIKTYNELRLAVIYRADTISANDALIPPEFQNFRLQDLQFYRNAYRQNIDYSVLVFLLFWGLNVVDAAVDAHLKAFDVSGDLSLKLKPGFNYTTNSAGLTLVLKLKDNSERKLKPLPGG